MLGGHADASDIELAEVVLFVMKLRSNKTFRSQSYSVEQYKASNGAVLELHSLLSDNSTEDCTCRHSGDV